MNVVEKYWLYQVKEEDAENEQPVLLSSGQGCSL